MGPGVAGVLSGRNRSSLGAATMTGRVATMGMIVGPGDEEAGGC